MAKVPVIIFLLSAGFKLFGQTADWPQVLIVVSGGVNQVFDVDKNGASKHFEKVAPFGKVEFVVKVDQIFGIGINGGFLNYRFDNKAYSVAVRSPMNSSYENLQEYSAFSSKQNPYLTIGPHILVPSKNGFFVPHFRIGLAWLEKTNYFGVDHRPEFNSTAVISRYFINESPGRAIDIGFSGFWPMAKRMFFSFGTSYISAKSTIRKESYDVVDLGNLTLNRLSNVTGGVEEKFRGFQIDIGVGFLFESAE
ncbi:MAG: hypothetical protein AB7O48_09005 [Cyclobacteriaceae bacterium]